MGEREGAVVYPDLFYDHRPPALLINWLCESSWGWGGALCWAASGSHSTTRGRGRESTTGI